MSSTFMKIHGMLGCISSNYCCFTAKTVSEIYTEVSVHVRDPIHWPVDSLVQSIIEEIDCPDV